MTPTNRESIKAGLGNLTFNDYSEKLKTTDTVSGSSLIMDLIKLKHSKSVSAITRLQAGVRLDNLSITNSKRNAAKKQQRKLKGKK